MDLKQAAISTCMVVFVLSSMLGIGLGLRVSDIIAPLRNRRLVVLSLVANFVVMPFIAIALSRSLGLEESIGIGLLLLGMAGGAPFLPKLAQIAGGSLAFGVGVMAVFGTGGIFAGVGFLAAGVGVGWILGGPARETRSVLGLGTAQRNIAAALVVANQSFDDPNVAVMVVVIAIVGLFTLMPLARTLGRAGQAPKA